MTSSVKKRSRGRLHRFSRSAKRCGSGLTPSTGARWQVGWFWFRPCRSERQKAPLVQSCKGAFTCIYTYGLTIMWLTKIISSSPPRLGPPPPIMCLPRTTDLFNAGPCEKRRVLGTPQGSISATDHNGGRHYIHFNYTSFVG